MHKIVHLSNTPLVGAPGKICALANLHHYHAIAIVFNDYPDKNHLDNKFLSHSILWNENEPYLTEHLIKCVENADIIHIHNDIHPQYLRHFNFSLDTQKFIYQTHSPLREGPLFNEKSDGFDFNFDKKLVIAQYHTRFYNEFTPVPNIVLENPSLKLKEPHEKLRIMYSPTHNQNGRWNTKYSKALDDALHMLKSMQKIDIITLKQPLAPNVLLEIRRSCHVSIDEIATGSYHQVSLEGLCCGNVVINNADIFSNLMLSNVAKSNELPPFYTASSEDIAEKLFNLASNDQLVRNLQQKSNNYYQRYLMPNKLFLRYDEIYKELLK